MLFKKQIELFLGKNKYQKNSSKKIKYFNSINNNLDHKQEIENFSIANDLQARNKREITYLIKKLGLKGEGVEVELWFPKVRRGGLFAGDDYLFTPRGETPVKDAVDEFVAANNLKLYLTNEKFPRWYLIKP
jgi:hypothetical protein